MKWIRVNDRQPPDEVVAVRTDLGEEGVAQPTYWTFKVGKRTGGKYTEKITQCEPYWDGGWMVDVSDWNFDKLKGVIVEWKPLKNTVYADDLVIKPGQETFPG